MSNLEQNTILKGGACSLIGNIQGCVNWSKCVADYLLLKTLQSQKYKKVCVIAMDINVEDLKSLTAVTLHDLDSRLLIFSDWSSFEQFWDAEIVTKLQVDNECFYGIFLYSMSEWLLNSSIDSIVPRVNRIIGQCNSSTRNADSVESATIQSTVLFVSLIYYSLHSSSMIGYLQSLFPTTIVVKPNDGTLSAEMAAEIQTVRRSVATSKMFEFVDYFTWKQNMLSHIPKLSDGNSSSVSTNNENALLKPKESESHNEETTEELELKNTLQNTIGDGNIKINSRLITFDSTDPEFDEDDDPDQDLDL